MAGIATAWWEWRCLPCGATYAEPRPACPGCGATLTPTAISTPFVWLG